MDPSIIKFVPWQHKNSKLQHRVGDEIKETDLTTLDAPNCWYISNNTKFNPEAFTTENSVNWGGKIEEETDKGFKVTMFAALRMLY